MLEAEIGGGTVRRAFTRAGKTIPSGTKLSRAEILAIPPSNRRVLIDMGSISVHGPIPAAAKGGKPEAAGERFVIACANGRYDVIEGRRLNPKPLTLKQAEKLAVSPAAKDAQH